jgi:hypothetical protein
MQKETIHLFSEHTGFHTVVHGLQNVAHTFQSVHGNKTIFLMTLRLGHYFPCVDIYTETMGVRSLRMNQGTGAILGEWSL